MGRPVVLDALGNPVSAQPTLTRPRVASKPDPERVLAAARRAVAQGRAASFLSTNSRLIDGLDTDTRIKLNDIITPALGQKQRQDIAVKAAGAQPLDPTMKVAGYPAKQIYKATADVINIPAGGVQQLKAVVGDAKDTLHGHPTVKRTAGAVKAIGKGVAHTVTHPTEDLFQTGTLLAAGAAGVAGGVGRAGAVGAAIRETPLSTAVGALSKAESRAYRVLADPAKHLAKVDEGTAQMIEHPPKRLLAVINQDPHLAAMRTQTLKAIGNGKVTPRPLTAVEKPAAVARAVGHSKPAQVAKAAVKTTPPVTRTLTVPGKDGQPAMVVHPLASKNRAAGLVQRDVIDRARQKQLDAGKNVDVTGPLARPATTLARHGSAQAAVGREMRAERTVTDALELAPVSRLERFAPTAPARGFERLTRGRVSPATAIVPRGDRLTGAEQKAVDISASELPASEHIRYHQNLLARGVGSAADHRTQIALAKAAEPHLDAIARGEAPKLAGAVAETRAVSRKAEQIKGMGGEEAAHRIGARQAEISAGAAGVESPLQRIDRLEQTIQGARPSKDLAAEHADLTAKLQANLAQQAAYKTPPRTAQRLTGGAAKGRAPDAGLAKLRRHESLLRTRISHLDTMREIHGIHKDITDQGFKAVEGGAFYLPSKDRALTRMKTPATRAPSVYGIGPQGNAPWLAHSYTGALERSGRARTDATRLAGESYRQAQRYATLDRGYKQLLQVAKDTPAEAGGDAFATPIRTTVSIPEGFKRLLGKQEAGTITREEAKRLSQQDADALAKSMFPNFEDLTPEEQAKVKWVDANYLRVLAGEGRNLGGADVGGKILDTVNAPFRAALLYTKPAYALNLVQALGTNVIQQGVFAPANLMGALRLGKTLGAEDQHAIFSLVGQGLSRSFEAQGGMGKAAINKAGETWNVVIDRYPRVASFLHEARREGFNTPEKIHSLLTDQGMKPTLVRVTQRANREAIEYGNLSPFEAQWLRRAVFFYPWIRGATLYSLRFLREHPVQAAAAAQIGGQGQQAAQNAFGPLAMLAPGMEGEIPFAGGQKGANLTNLNTFSTPVETGRSLVAPFVPGSQHANDLVQQLGPAAGAFYTLLSGKTTMGYELPAGQSRATGALNELTGLVPLVQAARRAKTPDRSLPASKQPVFPKGPGAAVRRFALSTVAPESLNLAAANARGEKVFKAGLTAEQKAKYMAVKSAQAATVVARKLHAIGVLPTAEVPPTVREALRLRALRNLEYAKAGVKPGQYLEQAGAILKVLATEGKISPELAANVTRLMASAPPSKRKSYVKKLWDAYGGGRTLAAWNTYATHVQGPR